MDVSGSPFCLIAQGVWIVDTWTHKAGSQGRRLNLRYKLRSHQCTNGLKPRHQSDGLSKGVSLVLRSKPHTVWAEPNLPVTSLWLEGPRLSLPP